MSVKKYVPTTTCTVNAIQFDGSNTDEVVVFLRTLYGYDSTPLGDYAIEVLDDEINVAVNDGGLIDTLVIAPTDWVIIETKVSITDPADTQQYLDVLADVDFHDEYTEDTISITH